MTKKEFVYRKEGLKLTKADEIVVEQREDIRELKERLYITEKALELAVADVNCDVCPLNVKCDSWTGMDGNCIEKITKFYLKMAKEMWGE